MWTYCFHVGDGESVGPEVTQDLVVEELLLHRVSQIYVVVQEKVFLEQEHMVARLLGQRSASRTVLLPLGHDVGNLEATQALNQSQSIHLSQF